MSPERLDRFAINVDMMGDAQEDSRHHPVLEVASPVSGVSEAVISFLPHFAEPPPYSDTDSKQTRAFMCRTKKV